MKYIAAIDQGTTSTRCLIIDKQAEVIATAQKEHQQIFPKPGWVEHDPIEIIENLRIVLQDALHKGCIASDDIASVGITNQRETTIAWNRETGKPYHHAIVWQDTRTDKICQDLTDRHLADVIKSKNGLPIATYFSGPKIQWLIENVNGIQKDLEKGVVCFGNIDAWLVWNLTGGPDRGVFATDVTNASRTMLFNLNTLTWDDELLEIFGIPKKSLPEIKPSSAFFGEISDEILAGVPVGGVLGDQQAALFGQLCFNPGDAKNTYGTGCFMLLNTGSQIIASENGLLTTVAYQIGSKPPCYALEGSIAITGALVQWLRDNLGIINNSAEIETLSKSVSNTGDVFFVPAFSGLYAPYWDANARGLIIGLTRYANKGHIARAALEATAYQTYDVLQAMQKDANLDLNQLKVDGGMVANTFLMQFQSDIIGKPVIRPMNTETTSIGAAFAAGLHSGYWHSIEALHSNWAASKKWYPKMDPKSREKLISRWHIAVDRSKNWAM